MKATVTWDGNMRFKGYPSSGHAISMDASFNVGGEDTAARPLELLLLGLGGCTGMDVIAILRKKRKTVTSLEISLNADQDEDHPRKLTRVTMTYRVAGPDLDENSVRRAIELSEKKYCSAAATLRFPMDINWNLELNRA